MQLRNLGANLCVDTKYGNERFGLETCAKDNPGVGGEQVESCLSLCLSVKEISFKTVLLTMSL